MKEGRRDLQYNPPTSFGRQFKKNKKSGRGAAWLAHLLWEQGVGGSNPLAPTSLPPETTFTRDVFGGFLLSPFDRLGTLAVRPEPDFLFHILIQPLTLFIES